MSMLQSEKTMQNSINPIKAAEEIRRLKIDLADCINELCLYCGLYKTRHKGSCDGCRWYKEVA